MSSTPPPEHESRRFRGSRVLLAGVFVVFGIVGFVVLRTMLTPAPEPDPAVVDASDPSIPPPATPEETGELPGQLTITEYPELRAAVLDTARAVPVGELSVAMPVVGMENRWAVHYGWFYLLELPLVPRTRADMDSLEAAGRIDETTRVGVVYYKVPVDAAGPDQLREQTAAHRPDGVPDIVLRELDRADHAGHLHP